MSKKPTLPRVGPRQDRARGFPIGRLCVVVEPGAACGRKGRGRGRVSPIQHTRSSSSGSPCCVSLNGPRRKSISRQGMYPADHPLMQRARRLAEGAL